MSKIRGDKGQMPTCPVLLKAVVETLFPAQQTQARGEQPSDNPEPPLFLPVDDNEIVQASERFGNVKASGLDGIPNGALKTAIKVKKKRKKGCHSP